MGTGMSRLITFGCSFTFGTGLKDTKDSWPSVLGQLTGRKVINKGVPGASNLEILNNILSFKFREDDLVVVGWTYCHRDLIFNSYKPNVRIGSGQLNGLFEKWVELHNNYDNNVRSGIYIHHAELYMNSMNLENYNFWAPPKATMIIDRLFDLTVSEYTGSNPKFVKKNTLYKDILNIDDLALDNSHPGTLSHKNAAEKLFRIINEK